jgi:uroporphyrin-III C-methyltransferase/precorrin-2 dehydrogenase/sirohydrochlorin ferrochelatase
VRKLLPVFLKLEGRRVVLVGGGNVAAHKVGRLLETGAEIEVIAPQIRKPEAFLGARLRRRAFRPSDLDFASFVVAAATPEVNQEVGKAALARGLFVNVVDERETATAFAGGVFERGGVTIAISTAGRAPALAGLLREALEALIPEEIELWVREAALLAAAQRGEGVPIEARRPLLLEALNRLYRSRGLRKAVSG